MYHHHHKGSQAMSASPLLTINAAADQLQRDRRTIAAHLRDIPPDDKDAQGRLRWRLATIVRALSNERPQRATARPPPTSRRHQRLSPLGSSGFKQPRTSGSVGRSPSR